MKRDIVSDKHVDEKKGLLHAHVNILLVESAVNQ